jgi:hypothetical protein
MKYAWIEDGRIRDMTPTDPFNWHHPDVAKFYDTQVPDEAENGDFWDEPGVLRKPPVPVYVEPAPAPRQWTADDFRSGMSLAEKTKWDNDSAPEVKTVKAELPKEEAGAQELVDFLVQSGVISQASATKIME